MGSYKIAQGQVDALNYDLGSIIRLLNNQDSEISFFQLFANWMRFLYKKDIIKIVDWNEKISSVGRKNQIEFCNYSIKIIMQEQLLGVGWIGLQVFNI